MSSPCADGEPPVLTLRAGRAGRDGASQSHLGRVLLSELAAERGLDCPVAGWSPRGAGPPRHPGLPAGLHAGLTHRRGKVIAALSEVPPGLDLELSHPRHRRHLAARVELLPEPWVRRRILEAESPQAAFYRAWTLHEALFKLETLCGRPPATLLATRLGRFLEPGGPLAWRRQAGDVTFALCTERPAPRLVAPAGLPLAPLTPETLV